MNENNAVKYENSLLPAVTTSAAESGGCEAGRGGTGTMPWNTTSRVHGGGKCQDCDVLRYLPTMQGRPIYKARRSERRAWVQALGARTVRADLTRKTCSASSRSGASRRSPRRR